MLIRQTLLEPCWSLHVCNQAQEAVQYTILLAVNSVRLYLFSCKSFTADRAGLGSTTHYYLAVWQAMGSVHMHSKPT